MNLRLRIGGALLGLLACAGSAVAQPAGAPGATAVIFENVRIFDGKTPRLSAPSNVLVVGNLIQSVSAAPATAPAGAAVTRIAGGGRTLMPGLIDAHVHLMFATVPQVVVLTGDIGFVNVAAAKAATDMLLRGFTSVRDLGGPVFGLKRGIDAGLVPGPRILPSGAFISQSGGHGDFRLPNDLPARPGDFTYSERTGAAAIADSPDLVRQRVREPGAPARARAARARRLAGQADGRRRRLVHVRPARRHAVHRARTARGGQSRRELGHVCHRARLHSAGSAAGDRSRRQGHRPRPAARRRHRAPDCGEGRVVEPAAVHGRRAIDLSARFAQPRQAGADVGRHGCRLRAGPEARHQDRLGHRCAVQRRGSRARQGADLVKLARWYAPAEILKMATADNAELLALSGLRSPYPGRLGVVEAGALADLLLVDGDPLADLALVADPGKNFVVIMKDGKLYKNTLRP